MGASPLVVAVVTHDERSDPAVGVAVQRGLDDGAQVILYDIDAAPSFLESPLPTEWSAAGTDEAIPPALTPAALHAAGQATLATKVEALTDAGIVAYGWLPGGRGADELATYADGVGASEIITSDGVDPTPADLEARGAKVTTASP